MSMKLSLRKTNLRSQVSASYALMAILPILGLCYLIWAYVDPEVMNQESVIAVIAVVVTISLLGFVILSQVIKALSDFREHLKAVVEDRILDTAISDDEPTSAPSTESLEDIVYNLIKHNSHLSGMFSEMEDLTWQKTRDLTKANLELQRQAAHYRKVEQKLRKSNMQLSDALTKLKELQKCIIQHERLSALGQLARGIAHDINNALMPVLGFAELILEDESIMSDKDGLKNMVSDMLNGAKEVRDVVAKLRSFYRTDRSLNFTEVNAGELLDEVKNLTKPRWAEEQSAEAHRIEFETHVDAAPSFQADSRLLTDSLVDVIMNAVDAMPAGGKITASVKQEDNEVVISIADTGIGMDRHACDHCMEPFFTTKGEEATGMGLALAYGTVRRHSGTIEVESDPGEGTTVTVRLPLHIDLEEELPAHKPGTTPDLNPLNILIIDDDAKARTTLESILKSARHTVTLASSGKEGIHLAHQNTFDAIITDRAMPDLSGDEVAEAIHKEHPDVPIVMVTGFGDMMNAQRQKPVGVSRVIPKPVDTQALKWALFDLTQ